MRDAIESSDVTYVNFPGLASSAIDSLASIATFPVPAGCGRSRGSRVSGLGPNGVGGASDGMIGESAEMLEIGARLRRIAPSQAAVMIVGESGTGKEVAAQLLHTHSARAGAPFVAVNCGAIPPSLVEAELFGYERGAFTGAVRQHHGYFERASTGTLFLDEITEMPIELQAKLLRVLETGRIVRVGGSEEIAVDVRIVTASNRAPEAMVRDRLLREDLYYRLAVFLVRMPPLRQRDGDVEMLAQAFLERLNAEYGTRKRFVNGALALARSHPWPGNVRELKNCVERSFVLADDLVELDLQPAYHLSENGNDSRESVRFPIGVKMAEAERELLLATLRHCGGNKRRTADVLGVSLKTVYNKLVGYGLDSTLLRAAGNA